MSRDGKPASSRLPPLRPGDPRPRDDQRNPLSWRGWDADEDDDEPEDDDD